MVKGLLTSVIVLSLFLNISCERSIEVERRRANELAALGRIDKAKKLYLNIEKRARGSEDYIELLLEAGDVLLAAGDKISALYYYEGVIKEAPLSKAAFVAHQKRAKIFMGMNRPEGAVEEYWSLIRHFSDNPKSKYFEMLLAESELAAGQLDNAISTANALMNSGDESIVERAMFVYAEAIFFSKKWSEAIIAYKKLIKKFPKSQAAPEAVCRIAAAYQAKGEMGSAKATLKKSYIEYSDSVVVRRCLKAIVGIVEKMKENK